MGEGISSYDIDFFAKILMTHLGMMLYALRVCVCMCVFLFFPGGVALSISSFCYGPFSVVNVSFFILFHFGYYFLFHSSFYFILVIISKSVCFVC